MATPSLAMIPSAIADAKVFSVLPNNGDGDFTFDRASTATRVGQNGLIETVAIDLPRLNYDISNGVVQSCPSLLLEPASTNLITYSEDFSNAYWTKSGTSVVSDSATSPDGTLNADNLTEDSSNAVHFLQRNFTGSSGSSYTYRIFVKMNGRKKIMLRESGSTGYYVAFDLLNNTILDQSNAIGTINKIGNDWVELTHTSVSGTAFNIAYFILPDNYVSGQPQAYQGDGTSGFYIFGAMLEALSYATSYIPTNGASQTRTIETCIKENLSSTILNPSYPFSMYAKCDVVSTNSGFAITLSNPLVNNQYFTIEYFSNLWHITSRPNGASIRVSSTTAPTIGTHKVLGIFTQSDMKLYLNGSLIVSGTNNEAWNNAVNGLLLGQLRIVSDTGSRNTIREAQFFKTELTNAQAVTLTTL